MDFEQQAAAVRFERAVYGAGRAAGIGAGREAFAALALGIVADGQIAVEEIHLFPIFVHERLGREHAGRFSRLANPISFSATGELRGVLH